MSTCFSLLVITSLVASTAVVLSTTQAATTPPQNPVTTADAAQTTPTFKVDVSVLTMSVTVVDAKTGKSVTGLNKDDFVLFEDGEQRRIAGFRAVTESTENRVPIGLGLVLDVSGSMTHDKLDAMRTAVEAMINKRLTTPGDQIYFMGFGPTPKMVVPWTSDGKEILTAIRTIKTQPHGTAIYDAVAAALPISAQGKNKKEVILVITDGADTNSRVKRAQLVEMARRSEVMVYALVVGEEPVISHGQVDGSIRQHVLELSQVTDATGGRAQVVSGFQELEAALGTFGKDLTSQYEVSFERSGAKDGVLHQVRIGVRRQGVLVRHKLGYVAN